LNSPPENRSPWVADADEQNAIGFPVTRIPALPTETLDYASPAHTLPPKWLTVLRRTALTFPVLTLLALYGQWFLSWAVLGHPPRPSLDDPKDITGANWMHPITGILLMTYFPAGVMAFALNVAHTVFHQPMRRRILSWTVFFVLWLGAIALLIRDPGKVLYWWFD
jgi:hypothetical protein